MTDRRVCGLPKLRHGIEHELGFRLSVVQPNVARSFVEAGIGITLANALIASRQARPNIVVRRFEINLPHKFAAITSRNAPRSRVLDTIYELLRSTSKRLTAEIVQQ